MGKSKLSRPNCDSDPTERHDGETNTNYFDEIKSSRKELFYDEWGTCLHIFKFPRNTFRPTIKGKEGKQALLNIDEDSKSKQSLKEHLHCHLWHKSLMKGVGNVIGRSSSRSGKLSTEKSKLGFGRFVKYGGCSSLEMPVSQVCFLDACLSFAAKYKTILVFLTAVVLLLMPSAGVEGALTSVPINSLFVVGKTARINCSTDMNQPVYWSQTLVGSSAQQWLYYGKNGFDSNIADGRFSIDKDEATGRYDVIIADIQLKDAGEYTCIDESGLGAGASAELVVSDPINCVSHIPRDGVMGYNVFGIEQDFIQFSCSLIYAGNLSPTLEWSWPGSVVQGSERAASHATSSITSTLKLSPTKEQHNRKFQCKTNFKGATQITIDSALLWESESVNVIYAEFDSKEVDVCPGVKWNLVCNPQCSYRFEIKDSDCHCLYTYNDTRTQQKYELTSDAVKCGKDNDIRVGFWIAVPVVFASAAAIVCLLVWVCYLKKNKPKRVEKNEEALLK